MKHSPSFPLLLALAAAPAVAALSVALPMLPSEARAADPSPEPAQRYPYDPVCPWGRVADGQGMLVRCLSSTEAAQFTASTSDAEKGRTAAASPAAATARAPLAAAAPAPLAPPLATAAPAPPLAAAAPAPLVPPPQVVAEPAVAPPARRTVVKAVNPAHADTGELPEAHRQLGKAEQRYVQCVDERGGLEADSARVTFRFLVRERGRAEGVTVKERRGVSPAAAKCMAEVIDRRYVGYPAAPIVGATLTIDLAAEAVR